MYKILEIDNKLETEQLGTKDKFWCEHDGKKYLFKIGREGTGENWAEKVACEIGKLIGLPVAEYEFAKFGNDYGVASLDIADDKYLIHGVYGNPVCANNLASALNQVLSHLFIVDINAALINDSKHKFIGYLIFDCFIANPDRHFENWGLLNNELAPSYDHASGLGCRVSEKEAEERLFGKDKRRTVLSFCQKAKSHFCYVDTGKISPFDICYEIKHFNEEFEQDAQELAQKDYLDSIQNSLAYWIKRIETIEDTAIKNIFDQIPKEYHTHKYAFPFAEKLLFTNKDRLLGLLND